MRLLLLLVAVTFLVAAGLSNKQALETCLERHSADTCYYTLR